MPSCCKLLGGGAYSAADFLGWENPELPITVLALRLTLFHLP